MNKKIFFKTILVIICFICSLSIYLSAEQDLKVASINKDVFNPLFSVQGEDFNLDKVTPKIFVPGEGSRVEFDFDNPNFMEVTIRIFNISGALVKKNLMREDDTESKMYWYGKDDNNKFVDGGIYIYQVESDGKVFNGTIIVAR